MNGVSQGLGSILVTGGNGFLGSYVCRELARSGRKAIAFDLGPPPVELAHVQQSSGPNIGQAIGDITDPDVLVSACAQHGAEAIVHTAGLFIREDSAIVQGYAVNVMGTVSVLEAARRLNLRRVVQISSNAVYQAEATKQQPMPESAPVVSTLHGSPAGHYGAAKVAAEVAGLTYASSNDVDVVILRVSSLYGFGMRLPLNLAPLLKAAVNGSVCHLPSGAEITRDYTHVSDAARAVIAAISVDTHTLRQRQRIFNISGGQLYSAAEVADLIRAMHPEATISVAAGMSVTEAADLEGRASLDGTAARELLGFTPEFDLASGLESYERELRAYLESRPRVN